MANIDEYGNIIERDNNYVRKPGKNKTKCVIFFDLADSSWIIFIFKQTNF